MKRIIQIFIMFSALMLSACQSEMDKNSTMEENPVVTEAQTTLDVQITEKTMENVDMQITEELDTTKPEQEVLFVYSDTGDDYNSNSVWVIDVEGNCRFANVEIKDLLSQEDWYDLLINNLDDEIKSMVTGEQLDVMYDFINQGVYGGLVKSIYDIKDYPGTSIYLVHRRACGDMELLKLASFGYYCECRSSKKARKFVKWLSEIGRFTLAGASFEDVYGEIAE